MLVDRNDDTQVAAAFGLAERGLGDENDLQTQFGLASVAKGFTALTVMSLAEGTPSGGTWLG